MPDIGTGYTTTQLTPSTFPSFAHLFSQGNGWDFCACTLHHRGRHLRRADYPTRADMAVRNLSDMSCLVDDGRANGILVHAGDHAVGWCQFGRGDVLCAGATPVGETSGALAAPDWRITCFVVDKAHRGQGVARLALASALQAIASDGGGTVEAYPLVDGRPSEAHGGYASTFADQGFTTVGAAADDRLVVRRSVRGRPPVGIDATSNDLG